MAGRFGISPDSRNIPVSRGVVTPQPCESGFVMILLIAACTIAGFMVSTTATALVRRLAPAWGLVDQPGARKVHTAPTPLGGGLGIACGVLVPLAAAETVVWLMARGVLAPDWLPAPLAEHLAGVAFRSGQLWSIAAAGIVMAA